MHQKLFLKSEESGGEPLGTELLDWGKKVLGVNINELWSNRMHQCFHHVLK